jgi:hypothetical protein
MLITPQQLLAAVQTHWAAAPEVTSPTVYPGVRSDTSRWPEWYELWVDVWNEPTRRRIAPDQLELTITIHCFAQRRDVPTAAQRLADAARETLAGRVLSVVDGSPGSTVGAIAILEHRVVDLTRDQHAAGHPHLQHLVVSFAARAQQYDP